MKKEDCFVGQIVRFGRRTGATTLAEVIKINPKKAKVKTLEKRGKYMVGAEWGVPYSMMREDRKSTKQETEVKKLKYSRFQPQEDIYILQAIAVIYEALLPENLSCDAKGFSQQEKDLRRKLYSLSRAIGQEVSESEVKEWQEERRREFVKEMQE